MVFPESNSRIILDHLFTMIRISGKTIDLRPVTVADAAFILSLRLDPSRNRCMSPVTDDVGAQIRWIEEYLERNRLGQEYYFVIESKQGEDLGKVRVYNIEVESFSWGSWMMRPGSPVRAASESAMLIYQFGFYQLKRAVSCFEVRKGNRVLEFHRRMGAAVVDETEEDLIFRFPRSDFESIKPRYRRLLEQ